MTGEQVSSFPNIAGSYAVEIDYFRDDCLAVGPSDFPNTLFVNLVVTQDGENITIVSGTTTFVGTVEMNGDFTAIDTSPSTATAGSCRFSTLGGYGGNFLTGLFILVIAQSRVSGSCAILGLPCTVDFAGTITAKGWADENAWTPDMLVDIIEQATITAAGN